jgi:hypothetical protein
MPSRTALWMLTLPDDDFGDLVASDCAGTLDPEGSEALRETAVLPRWIKTLDGLTAFPAHRAEAARLLTMRTRDPAGFAAEQQASASRREDRKRAARVASGYKGTSNMARKRAAGRTAVDRLIEAHHDEFSRYLDEAHTELDVPAGQTIRVRRLVAVGLTWLAAEDFVTRKWPEGDLGAGVRLTVTGQRDDQ